MVRTLAAAALLLAAAPALAEEPCLQMNTLFGWHELDKHSMVLEDIAHNRFKVDYSGYCGNLKFVLGIGVQSQSGSQLACLQRGDYLLVRQAGGMSLRCVVQKVEPYSGPPSRS